MTVKDLEAREELTLVTNKEDIEIILNDIGESDKEYGCLFVDTSNGEYGDVYSCRSNIPYLHFTVNKLTVNKKERK